MTRGDFLDWKSNDVTLVIFQNMETRIKDAYEVLGNSAGSDPLQDKFLTGMIRAYKEILAVEWNDIEDELDV